MFNDVALFELSFEKIDRSVSHTFSKLPPNKLVTVNFTHSLKLLVDFTSNSVCFKLIYKIIVALTNHYLSTLSFSHLLTLLKTVLSKNVVNFTFGKSLDLNLHLVASSVLVFNVRA